ncbi:MAG TPA: DNA polymerase I [Gemmatimonadales bacterium]|nr:DNA polymerase I [Gemmatimonadales bacterium]
MPNHTPPQLFLIDGYALIYRAFFAMIARPLRTTKGENTSAAWGVVNFLLRLRDKYRPDYVAWVNDAGTSFREARYPEYKSTREKLDDSLQADFDRAVERISALLEAFRIPLVAVRGYEADDVIGTLATAGAARGLRSVIVSGDKDFYQLIGPGICLLNPGRGGPAAVDEVWVDESNGAERLGVPPGQVVDFLALVGDSSDNIPGVKGIGEKGAQKLLADYGDLETILARAPEITAKRTREALLAQADNARLSKELVTIQRDVPVELDVDDLVLREPDREAAIRILTELEFFSLAKRLGGPAAAGAGPGAAVAAGVPAAGAPAAVAGPASASAAAPAAAPGAAPAAVPGAAPGPTRDDGSYRDSAAESDPREAAPAATATLPATAADWHALDQEQPLEVTVLVDPDDLPALVARLRAVPLIGLDVESTSLAPHDADLVGLSLAASPREVWYLPFGHVPTAGELAAPAPVKNLPPIGDFAMAPLVALLEDPSVKKAAHNIKYDWQVLRRAGVELAGVAYDSMLASFVLDPGRRSHAIDTLCLEHFGRTLQTYADLTGRGKAQIPFAEVTVQAAAGYCGSDAATALTLHEYFAPALRDIEMEPLLREIEMPLVEVLTDMEWEGISIDPAVFDRLNGELGAELRRLEGEIATVAGEALNLNSPRQLATILFEKQQLPVLKRTKTGPSTDADVLEQLAAMGHALPQLILDYRELQKLKSTYVDTLPATVNRHTGRIHTSFNQTGAATGRLSSSDPNLQNIPIRTPRGEEIRRGFVPRAGWQFLVADYSQIELRIMAHLSGDPAFIEAFHQGGDIHRQTAALIFGVALDQVTADMRARAKTINFATIYGQGPFALSRQLGISQEDAKSFIARYFERFAGVRAFLDRQIRLAREQGYVETIFKRRRYIPEIKDRNFNMRAYGERNAQNSPLQGSAADLIKLAMIRIHDAIQEHKLRSRMLLQVHDELVFEAPPEELEALSRLVREHMEHVVELKVPLVVDIGVGPNWLDAKR